MSRVNFAKTLFVFAGTVIAKHLGLKRGKPEIESIFNYVKISETLSTSGQPTEEQFGAIRDAGFEAVINLLPQEKENALKNEEEVVRGLGLDYTYIPVVFTGPTEEDFSRFAAAMRANERRQIWVHCAVNARVSVFVARYRTEILGEPVAQARAPIGQVWEPYGVWKAFLEQSN
ncbi:MAG: protein tyrosine phosphatase family protein [Pseudomonadota bacterium]